MNVSRTRVTLGVAAGLAALVYGAAFLAPYPLLRFYATPLLDLGKLTRYGRDELVFMAGAYAALFAFYAVAYECARRAPDDVRVRLLAFGAPVVFVLMLVWVFPIGAIDVYDYTFYGRMLAHYHESPLLHTPLQFSGDAWFPFVGWQGATSPYGPLWQWISASVYTLVGESLLGNLLGYKLIAALSGLLCGALVYAILRRMRPAEALAGWVFVAWNPLLLVETAANAHNDAPMVVAIVLAVFLFQRGRLTWAVVSLTAALLIKFPAIAVMPVFGVAALWRLPDWRARIRWVALSGAAALALVLAAYLPLAERTNPFANVLSRGDLFTASFATVLMLALKASYSAEQAQMLARTAAMGVFGVILLWIALRRRGDDESLARGLFGALLALLVLATLWFQPWYVVWVIALAPLGNSVSRRVTVIFAASVLAIYFMYDFVLWWDPGLWSPDGGLMLNVLTVTLVFVPPLAVLALELVRSGRRLAPVREP